MSEEQSALFEIVRRADFITIPLLQQQGTEKQPGKTANHSVLLIGVRLVLLAILLSESALVDMSPPPNNVKTQLRQSNIKTQFETYPGAQRQKQILKLLFPPSFWLARNEKCYLCKSLVPFREYQSHVESCLQLARGDQGDGPEESGRICSAMEEKWRQRLRNPKVCMECFRKLSKVLFYAFFFFLPFLLI